MGPARGSPRENVSNDRQRTVRLWYPMAASIDAESTRQPGPAAGRSRKGQVGRSRKTLRLGSLANGGNRVVTAFSRSIRVRTHMRAEGTLAVESRRDERPTSPRGSPD